MSKETSAEEVKAWLKNGLKQSSPLTQKIVQNWTDFLGQHVMKINPKTMAQEIGDRLNVPVDQWIDYAAKVAGPLLEQAGRIQTPGEQSQADDYTSSEEDENEVSVDPPAEQDFLEP